MVLIANILYIFVKKEKLYLYRCRRTRESYNAEIIVHIEPENKKKKKLAFAPVVYIRFRLVENRIDLRQYDLLQEDGNCLRIEIVVYVKSVSGSLKHTSINNNLQARDDTRKIINNFLSKKH